MSFAKTEQQMNRLDLDALWKKKSRIVSSEEALKDVIPIQWDNDILEGRKKVTVFPSKEENSTCAK